MTANNDDILVKLQATVESWTQEVTLAHLQLTHQISDAKDQLGSLVKILAARSKNASIMAQTIEESEADHIRLEKAKKDLDELRSAKDLLETEVASLNEEIDAYQHREEDIKRTGQTLSDALDTIKAKDEETGKAYEETRKGLEELKTGVAEQGETLKQVAGAAADISASVQTVQAGLTAVQESTEAFVGRESALAEECQAQRSQIAEKDQGLAQKEAGLLALRDERDALLRDGIVQQGEIASAQAVAETAETLRNRLDNELRAATETAAEANAEIQALKRLLQEKEEGLASLTHEKEELSKRVGEDTGKAQRLENELAKLQQNAVQMAKTVAEDSEIRQTLEDEAAHAIENANQVNSELGEALREKDDVDEALAKAREESAALEQQAREALAQKDGLTADTKALRASMAALEEIHGQQLADLKANYQSALDREAILHKAANDLEARAAQLTQAEATLREQLERAHVAKKKFEDDDAGLRARIEILQAQNEALDSEKKHLAEEKAQSDEKRKAAEQNAALQEDAAEQLEGLRDGNLELAATISRLEEQLKKMQARGPEPEARGPKRRELDEYKAELLTFEAFVLDRERLVKTAAHYIGQLEHTVNALAARIENLATGQSQGTAVASGDLATLDLASASINALRETNEKLRAVPISQSNDDISEIQILDGLGRTRMLGDVLVDAGVITPDQLDQALSEQREGHPRPLGKILVDSGVAGEQIVNEVIAAQQRLPSLDFEVLSEVGQEQSPMHDPSPDTEAELTALKGSLQSAEAAEQEQTKQIQDKNTEIEGLQRDLAGLREETSLLSESRNSYELGLRQMRADLEAAETALAERENRLGTVERELTQKGDALDTFQIDLQNIRLANEERARESDALAKDLQASRTGLEAAKAEVQAYETHVAELSDAADRIEKELLERAAEHERHTAEFQGTASRKEEESQAQIAAYEERVNDLSAQIGRKEDELQTEMGAREQRENELAAQIGLKEEDLQTESAQHEARVNELHSEIGRKEEAFQSHTTENELRLNQLETALQQKQEELQSLTETYDGRIDELHSAASQNEQELNGQVRIHKEQLDELGASLAGKEGELQSLQTSLKTVEAQSAEKSEQCHQLAQAVEKAGHQIQELERSALQKEQDIANQMSEIQARLNSMRALQVEVEDLKLKLVEDGQGEDSNDEVLVLLDELSQLKDALTQRNEEIEVLREQAGGKTGDDPQKRIAIAAYDAVGRRRSMGEILVNAGIITEKQLESALEEQKAANQRRLGTILVERGLIREEVIAQVLASQLQLPFVRLNKYAVQEDAVSLIDGALATHHMCIPVSVSNGRLILAMANPLDVLAIEELEYATKLEADPVVATLPDITSAIVRHYGAFSRARDSAPKPADGERKKTG